MFWFNVLRKSTKLTHTKLMKNKRKESELDLSKSQSQHSLWTSWALTHEKAFSESVGPTHYFSPHVTFLAKWAWSHLNGPCDSCRQLFWNALKSHSSHMRWGQWATEGGNPQEGEEEGFGGRKAAVCLVCVILSSEVNVCKPPQPINSIKSILSSK